MQSLGSAHPIFLSFLAFRIPVEHLFDSTVRQSFEDPISLLLKLLAQASNLEYVFGLFDPFCPDDLVVW